MGRGTLAGIAVLALLGGDALAGGSRGAAEGPVTHPTLDEPHVAPTRVVTKKAASKKVASKKVASKKVASKKVASKKVASKKGATRGHAKRATRHTHLASAKGGKLVAKRAVGTRIGRGTRGATSDPHPRVATSQTPLVTVAKLQADGRVKYGPDRLPPGFAWPPTPGMIAASRACEAQLDALGIIWKAADPEGMIADPILVPSMEIGGVRYTSAYRRKTPPAMDCQFVRALAALGPELRALGVAEVQFGSLYRNTLARSHGQTKDFLSRHALGIAMDVKAFVDDAGRVAGIETDYLKGDALLHGIEDLINKRTDFRDVLSPANDPISHDDHFHIEASVDFTAFR